MKKPILIFFILLTVRANSQSNWQQVNSGVQDFIRQVIFEDSTTGYALANNKILKSVDAGNNWNVFYVDTTITAFNGIAIEPDSLFVIGADSNYNQYRYLINKIDTNFIKKNEDHGNYNSFYKGMNYLNAKVWYTSENCGLMSYENGVTDTVISQANTVRIQEGYICAATNYNIYLSDDSSSTWDTITFPFQGTGAADCFYAGGDTIVYYGIGFPIFYIYSYDRGNSWNQMSLTDFPSNALFSFLDKDKMIGTRQRQDAIIYFSSDGGFNYESDTLNMQHILLGTYIYNEDLAFAYGANGVIYKSTNAGGLVGVKENRIKSNSFKIYPNPSKDQLQIEYRDESKIKRIEIYTIEGKLVKAVPTFQKNIDISKYSSGKYAVKLITEKGTLSKVFIID